MRKGRCLCHIVDFDIKGGAGIAGDKAGQPGCRVQTGIEGLETLLDLAKPGNLDGALFTLLGDLAFGRRALGIDKGVDDLGGVQSTTYIQSAEIIDSHASSICSVWCVRWTR